MDPRARLLAALLLTAAVMALPAGGPLWLSFALAAVAPFTVPLRRPRQSESESDATLQTRSAPTSLRTLWFRFGMLLLSLSWMIVLTIVIQGFVTPGHIVWSVPGFRWTVTEEGLWRGALFTCRLVAAVLAGGSVAFALAPLDAMRAMESLLSPLRRLGLATGGPALAFGLALRYIPTLFEEARQLRNALRARGWNEGRGLRKVGSWLPLVLPLLVGGLRRSDDIAASLYIRGYDPAARRGALYPLQWRFRDTVTLSVASLPLLVFAAIWLRSLL